MAGMKVLDAYALIAFFANEPGADFVRTLLLEASAGSLDLALSVVNLGEIWYTVARVASPNDADEIIIEIQGLPIEIVDADWELTRQAAQFKAGGGISYADCYAAALGKLLQAEVVTGDPEFEKLKEEIVVYWSEK